MPGEASNGSNWRTRPSLIGTETIARAGTGVAGMGSDSPESVRVRVLSCDEEGGFQVVCKLSAREFARECEGPPLEEDIDVEVFKIVMLFTRLCPCPCPLMALRGFEGPSILSSGSMLPHRGFCRGEPFILSRCSPLRGHRGAGG